jgi:mono/diheme cytochrome c family protein
MRRRQSARRRRRHLLPARKRRITTWVLIGIGVLSTVLIFIFQVDRIFPPRIDGDDAAQVAVGKRIYAEACASCHGASLEGQLDWQKRLPNGRWPAPPLDASGRAWRHTDRVLFEITKAGSAVYPKGYQTDMPAFGQRLTNDEIAAALAFIKSIWPVDIRARQTRLSLKFWVTAEH